jgi:hypothetical protein
MLPSERWALTPPFHPCQMRWPEVAGLRFCLAAAAEAVWFALAHHHRSGRLSDRAASRTGGFFSVALAVAFPTPKHRNDPLALPGALPFCPRPCGVRLCGVRTFLPPGNLAKARSAITRPARQIHYTCLRGFRSRSINELRAKAEFSTAGTRLRSRSIRDFLPQSRRHLGVPSTAFIHFPAAGSLWARSTLYSR